MSFFLDIPRFNHYFRTPVKHCLSATGDKDNASVLDAKKLAYRLREAMDGRLPKLTGQELAKECGVTAQAVSGWRKNGRIHKAHLERISELTGKPLEYFLGQKERNSQTNGAETHHEAFRLLEMAWHNASKEQREMLSDLAKTILERNARRKGRRSL